MDANHHSLAVDVADLQVDRFADPQTERIHRPEERSHPQRAAGTDDLMELIAGQNIRQRLDDVKLGFGQCFPVASADPGKKELDAAEGEAERTLSKLFLDFQIQQPAPQLRFADLIRRALAKVRQSPRPPQPPERWRIR
jgi:hypothetical protein